MPPKVLFVDDEPQILEALSQLFEAAYDVYTAVGGEAALEMMKHLPDLAVVVSDQRMPGMKGIDVLTAAQRYVPNATRILLTGFADADAVLDSVNVSAIFRYVKKPWKPSELEEVMRLAVAAHYSLVASSYAQAPPKASERDEKKSPSLKPTLTATLAALSALSKKAASQNEQASHSDSHPSASLSQYLTESVAMRLAEQQHAEETFLARLRQKLKTQQASSYASAFHGKRGKPQVLIVDDAPSVLDALTELLYDDYDVVCAANAFEALEYLEQNVFVALLLTDQRMPGKTGADLLLESRNYAPLVPKVLITAYTDVEDIVRLINEGQIYRYIQKPWDAQKLKALIDEAVEMYMLQLSVLLKDREAYLEQPVQEPNSAGKASLPSIEALQALQNLRLQKIKKDDKR
ncbi:MAG: response regulator [Candidatus Thermochlorobacter sp.]